MVGGGEHPSGSPQSWCQCLQPDFGAAFLFLRPALSSSTSTSLLHGVTPGVDSVVLPSLASHPSGHHRTHLVS